MSLEDITASIKQFLSTGSQEVMCLHGKWGVGKTYLWNQCLNEAQRDRAIKLNYYSYVSLFGMNSIEDVKLQLLVRTRLKPGEWVMGWKSSHWWLDKLRTPAQFVARVMPFLESILTRKNGRYELK